MTSPLTRRAVLRGTLATAIGAGSYATSIAAHAHPHRPKPTGRAASVAYIEVNDNSILNPGNYVLDDGTPAFNYAVIFAANINYDGTRAYLHTNENVQRVLDSADTLIRPLQDKGIKVLLSILGNHQGSGFANFPSPKTADDFAKQVAQVVHDYGLDGVDLDDEWVEYGKNNTGDPNDFSFLSMVASLRKRLPNKAITFYFIGPSAEHAVHDGKTVGDYVDYA